MTYKLFFSGIDGSGKTACADLLTDRLASKYRIVKTGSHDLFMYFKGKKILVARRRLYTKNELVGTRLRHHFYGFFLILNFVYKAITILYVKLLTKPDILIYEADSVLHPAAFLTYHFPLTRYFNRRLYIRFLGLFFGSRKSSVRVYLDVNPKTAMERINKRGTDGGTHENLADLTELKTEFDHLVGLAVKNGVEILTIDTNSKTLDEIARQIEAVVDHRLSSQESCVP